MLMDRVTMGIKGFDGLIEGGVPRGSTILLAGSPGTGKTIFALHYLCDGAAKGENGIYVIVDSGELSGLSLFKQQAEELGLEVGRYEKEGKITFLTVPLDQRKFDLFNKIEEIRKETNAKRVVFDSITTFMINLDLFSIPMGYTGMVASSVEGDATEALSQIDTSGRYSFQASPEKRFVYLAIETLRKSETTNLVVAYGNSTQETGASVTVDGVSEFACDGIIAMYNDLIGSRRIRTMSIIKMRNTNHSPYIHNFDITSNGIVVQPAEQVYK